VRAEYLRRHGRPGDRTKADPYQNGARAYGQKEIAAMPAIPAVWKDTLERLQKSDPELFEYRPRTAAAAD